MTDLETFRMLTGGGPVGPGAVWAKDFRRAHRVAAAIKAGPA